MSSKINYLIGRQAYELIRNRIGEILIEELNNQFTTYSNNFAKANVEVEGNFIDDTTEISKVIISLAEGGYSNQHQGSATGDYIFNIDCTCKSKSSSTVNGASNSSVKIQALVGTIRYILKDPQYKTLGFTPPFISGVSVSEIKFGEPNKEDLLNTTSARLIFLVKCNESNTLLNATLIAGYETTVTLGDSTQGYTYNPIPLP